MEGLASSLPMIGRNQFHQSIYAKSKAAYKMTVSEPEAKKGFTEALKRSKMRRSKMSRSGIKRLRMKRSKMLRSMEVAVTGLLRCIKICIKSLHKILL